MTRGFSLVELSIVLIILGLLTGGILAGQSLIRAAELRSLMAQTADIRTSFYAFQQKYASLPGDMPDAVKLWGAQTGSTAVGYDASCAALLTPATGTATCNGDGDGTIALVSPEHYESYRAWQHLANAGLIEGSYTGVTAAAIATDFLTTPGKNVAAAKIPMTGFTVRSYDTAIDSTTNFFPGKYGNILWLGSIDSTYTSYTNGPAFLPEEAWSIDTKQDDGLPAYGKIRVGRTYSNCHTNTDPALSEYAVNYKSKACSLIISLGL